MWFTNTITDIISETFGRRGEVGMKRLQIYIATVKKIKLRQKTLVYIGSEHFLSPLR